MHASFSHRMRCSFLYLCSRILSSRRRRRRSSVTVGSFSIFPPPLYLMLHFSPNPSDEHFWSLGKAKPPTLHCWSRFMVQERTACRTSTHALPKLICVARAFLVPYYTVVHYPMTCSGMAAHFFYNTQYVCCLSVESSTPCYAGVGCSRALQSYPSYTQQSAGSFWASRPSIKGGFNIRCSLGNEGSQWDRQHGARQATKFFVIHCRAKAVRRRRSSLQGGPVYPIGC